MKGIILLGGPAHSGKTTLAQALKEVLPNSVIVDGVSRGIHSTIRSIFPDFSSLSPDLSKDELYWFQKGVVALYQLVLQDIRKKKESLDWVIWVRWPKDIAYYTWLMYKRQGWTPDERKIGIYKEVRNLELSLLEFPVYLFLCELPPASAYQNDDVRYFTYDEILHHYVFLRELVMMKGVKGTELYWNHFYNVIPWCGSVEKKKQVGIDIIFHSIGEKEEPNNG